MKNQKLLQKYYNEKIKVKGMPEFVDLTDSNKINLAGTLGFAGYQVLDAVEKFNIAAYKKNGHLIKGKSVLESVLRNIKTPTIKKT